MSVPQTKSKVLTTKRSKESSDGEISSESEPEYDEESTLKLGARTGVVVKNQGNSGSQEKKEKDSHSTTVTVEKNGHGHGHGRKKKDVPKTGWRKYGGIIFGLGSCFFLSLAAAMVKVLGEYHPFTMSLWRHLAILIPSIPIVIFYVSELQGKVTGKKSVNILQNVFPLDGTDKILNFVGLTCRGLIGCTSIILKFYSLQYLSIPDASVINFSGVVVVFIFAHFCLGEKCGVVPIFVAALTLIGVTLVFRPPIITGEKSFDSDTLTGGALGLSSMLLHCMLIIIARKLRRIHFALMLISFGILGVIESALVAWYYDVLTLPSGLRDNLLVFGVFPIVVFGGQMCIILALKYESAGPVSLIRTCDLLLAFLWQFLFLSKVPDIYSIVAAFFIILGVVITTFRKWLGGLPETDKRRQRWRILLL